MQPRHQVNVVGDPTRQLLRRVHVRVHQSYPAAAEARKTKSTKIRLQFRWGGKNPIQSGGGPRPPTWEDDAAAEVEGLRGAREGGDDVGGGAHGGDAVAGDGDGAVPEDAELAVHGDDDRVAKDGVDRRRVGGHLRGSPPRLLGAAQARERPYDGAEVGFVSLRQGEWKWSPAKWTESRLESGGNQLDT